MRLTRIRLGLESQKRLSEANGRAEVAAVREGRPLPSGQRRAGRVARGSAWQPRRRIHSELWSPAVLCEAPSRDEWSAAAEDNKLLRMAPASLANR